MIYFEDVVKAHATQCHSLWTQALASGMNPIAVLINESDCHHLETLARDVPEVARSLARHPIEDDGGPWFMSVLCGPERCAAADPGQPKPPSDEAVPVTILGVAAQESYLLGDTVRPGAGRWDADEQVVT